MRHFLVVMGSILLSACSITHHTVYLCSWDEETLIDGRKKNYRVKMNLPKEFRLRSVSSAEFNVEYIFYNPYDSSTVFVSNNEPGLATILPDYNKLKKREFLDRDKFSSEFQYRHICYGYRNVSHANKSEMDSMINNVIIDSIWVRRNKGDLYQKAQEHKILLKAKIHALHSN